MDKQKSKFDLLEAFLNSDNLSEGLSFSDYFDDSVPYEVKPPLGFHPVEEVVLPNTSFFWMDIKGKFHTTEDHDEWAEKLLKLLGTPFPEEQASLALMKEKWVKVTIYGGIIHYEHKGRRPNITQMKALVTASQDSHFHLYDKTEHHVFRYDKGRKSKILPYLRKKVPPLPPYDEKDEPRNQPNFNKDNTGQDLFIEHMMPSDMDTFKLHMAQLFAYLKKELQLKSSPQVKLAEDDKNASKILGKTAYYDPAKKTVVLYITDRHQKDILRSFSHEIIHHWQHENEKLQTTSAKQREGSDPQYAQHNPWLRQMEKQAYLLGNILFRDWEDQKKAQDRKSSKKMVERTYRIGQEYPPRKMDYRGQ